MRDNGVRFTGVVTENGLPRFGVESAVDGSYYVGAFSNHSYDGHGRFRSPNGDAYCGGWAGGQPSGAGRWSYADGSRFEGCFSSGMKNGLGVATDVDGRVVRGNWRDDEFQAGIHALFSLSLSLFWVLLDIICCRSAFNSATHAMGEAPLYYQSLFFFSPSCLSSIIRL